ncbi:yolk ferritin [Elysia marginata]|uniref:Ferritin n=1 Tax=Elysia marginata TaxID=1093978 RepID=A0AAV4JAK5_9GAST|nr:yolk ferritin [Elysia marginata]
MESKFVKILAFLALVSLAIASKECCAEIKNDDGKECIFDSSCHEKGKCCPHKDLVGMVRQNYKCDIDCLLVQQIQLELRASYLYQGYASYFQRADVSLPGIQKFFAHASVEERNHAEYLIEYVNKRGGHVQIDQMEIQKTCEVVQKATENDDSGLDKGMEERMCICGFVSPGGIRKINRDCKFKRDQWMEGLMAFEDALAVERFVNKKLLDLHKTADDLGDAHLTHLLEHEFLEEQIQAIYELGLYVSRLRSFAPKNSKTSRNSNYKLGEYIFDQDLSKRLDKKKED